MNQPTDIFEMDDSEFTDVEKSTGFKQIKSPIIMTTISMRAIEKISLSFSEPAIAKLQGWPRFNISWNEKNFILRIRANTEGVHEAFMLKTGRQGPEKRYILRVPLQRGVKFVNKLREPVPHKYSEDGKTINIQIPPAFRIIYARPGVPAPQPGERLTPERLRQLEPAPLVGNKKG